MSEYEDFVIWNGATYSEVYGFDYKSDKPITERLLELKYKYELLQDPSVARLSNIGLFLGAALFLCSIGLGYAGTAHWTVVAMMFLSSVVLAFISSLHYMIKRFWMILQLDCQTNRLKNEDFRILYISWLVNEELKQKFGEEKNIKDIPSEEFDAITYKYQQGFDKTLSLVTLAQSSVIVGRSLFDDNTKLD